MTTCNCSINLDYCNAPSFHTATMRRARKVHRCCECHEDIRVGDQYEEVTGRWDGKMDRFRTCLSCQFIRDRYCPDGFEYGGLFEQIEECMREYPKKENDK